MVQCCGLWLFRAIVPSFPMCNSCSLLLLCMLHNACLQVQVNPFGKVPALQDGELCLFESGALLTYLADKYGELETAEERARASQWVLFANSTLANSVFVEQFRWGMWIENKLTILEQK